MEGDLKFTFIIQSIFEPHEDEAQNLKHKIIYLDHNQPIVNPICDCCHQQISKL